MNISSLQDFLNELDGVKPAGNGQYNAYCPAHDDVNHRSLSVTESQGKILVNCFKGCPTRDIVEGAGLTLSDLFLNSESTDNPFDIEETYDYVNSDNELIFQVVRTEDKQFPQRRFDEKGRPVWGLSAGEYKLVYGNWYTLKGNDDRQDYEIKEFEALEKRPLYNLPSLLEAIENDRWVMVVEGEKDVNNLGRKGIIATTNPQGTGEWKERYTRLFKGAKVAVIPDNDKPGVDHAYNVANSLLDVADTVKKIEFPRFDKVRDKHGEDVSDWLEDGGTKEELKDMIQQAPEWEGEPPPYSDDGQLELSNSKEKKPVKPAQEKSKDNPEDEEDDRTIHQKLLEIVEKATLFRTADNRMFAEVEEGGDPYVYEIKQKGAGGNNFRNWLIRRYKEKYGEGPNSTSISRTMGVVRADASVAEERDIYKRVADLDDKILIDLAGNQHRAVEVTPDGYEIIDNPDINFWRPDGVRSLPEPEGKISDIKYLQELINVGNEDFSLLVAWILATFQTAGPYPVLIPTGPAGSGKSTLTKLIRNLLDPAGNTGRATTRSIEKSEDLFSEARHRHLLALDNQSRLKQWQSDALSAIATGGGIEKRQLYTDDNLVTIDTMNPIVMNGIDISGIGNDLLDRAIFLELEEPEERMSEKEFWDDARKFRPEILGGLCELVSTALDNRDTVEISQKEMTRMADFTEWIKAATPAFQKIATPLENINPIEIYLSNRGTIGRDALEESELGSILIDFLKKKDSGPEGLLWRGTAGDLLEKLETQASEATKTSKGWPNGPAVLGKKLKRLKTTLEKVGIKHEKDRSSSKREYKFYEETPDGMTEE